MTALTVYYNKETKLILQDRYYPAKFVEYSNDKHCNISAFFPGSASLYLLPLLYATGILIYSTPGAFARLYCCHFLNKVFINLNALP